MRPPTCLQSTPQVHAGLPHLRRGSLSRRSAPPRRLPHQPLRPQLRQAGRHRGVGQQLVGGGAGRGVDSQQGGQHLAQVVAVFFRQGRHLAANHHQGCQILSYITFNVHGANRLSSRPGRAGQ